MVGPVRQPAGANQRVLPPQSPYKLQAAQARSHAGVSAQGDDPLIPEAEL